MLIEYLSPSVDLDYDIHTARMGATSSVEPGKGVSFRYPLLGESQNPQPPLEGDEKSQQGEAPASNDNSSPPFLELEYYPSKGVGFELWPAAFALADFVEKTILLPGSLGRAQHAELARKKGSSSQPSTTTSPDHLATLSTKSTAASSSSSPPFGAGLEIHDINPVLVIGEEDPESGAAEVLAADSNKQGPGINRCPPASSDDTNSTQSTADSSTVLAGGAANAKIGGSSSSSSSTLSLPSTTGRNVSSEEVVQQQEQLKKQTKTDTQPLPRAPADAMKDQQQLRFLELGCGVCALIAQVCAAYGHDAVATDDLLVVQNMHGNLENTNVRAVAANWYADQEIKAVLSAACRDLDYILMAEVVYFPTLFKPLLDTLKLLLDTSSENNKCCKKSVQILWANSTRFPDYKPPLNDFRKLAEDAYGFSFEEVYRVKQTELKRVVAVSQRTLAQSKNSKKKVDHDDARLGGAADRMTSGLQNKATGQQKAKDICEAGHVEDTRTAVRMGVVPNEECVIWRMTRGGPPCSSSGPVDASMLGFLHSFCTNDGR
ncbi:unnamed protein product [Amoebophrya sp. A120]|nr:unnamed protein product [Amoebophrya sp. A120]|eukprot:GSA120T00023282001.1